MDRKPYCTIDTFGHPSTAKVELIFSTVRLSPELDPKVSRHTLLLESGETNSLSSLSFVVALADYAHPENGGLEFTFEGNDGDRFVSYIRKTINWKMVPTKYNPAPDPFFEICLSVLYEGAEDAAGYALYETSSLIHQRIMMVIGEQYDFVAEVILERDHERATMVLTHSDPDHGVNVFRLGCDFRRFDDTYVDEYLGLPPKPKVN